MVHLETFWVRLLQQHSTWSPGRIIYFVWLLLSSPPVSGPQCPEVISSSTESPQLAGTCPYFPLHAYSTALHYVLFLNIPVSLHFSLLQLLGFNPLVRDTRRQLDKGSVQSPFTAPNWSVQDEENVLLPQVKSHSLFLGASAVLWHNSPPSVPQEIWHCEQLCPPILHFIWIL